MVSLFDSRISAFDSPARETVTDIELIERRMRGPCGQSGNQRVSLRRTLRRHDRDVDLLGSRRPRSHSKALVSIACVEKNKI